MKIVIAGGSGLIGRALGASFAADGHEVVVLTRQAGLHRGGRIRAVQWHPPGPGPWAAELRDAHAVVNLAGASIGRWPWTDKRKRLLRESRLTATRALVDAIASVPEGSRPAVLLSASGTDVYEGRDGVPADERTPAGSSFLARLSLDWEAEATRAEPLGVRVVVLRTSSVIARGASYLRVVTLPFRLFLGGRWGSGRQWVSWVGLEDVVRLYRFALVRDDITGPLNVAAPDARRQTAFARSLAAALGRPDWLPAPAFVVRLLLRDQATLALGSRRVWPGKALDAGFRFAQPRLEDALQAALGDREITRSPGAA